MMTFIVESGLSETDKRHLASPPPQPVKPKPKHGGVVTLDDRGVRWKNLNFRNAREWGCSFCKKQNASGQKRCNSCGAFLFQMGDLEFVYKTADQKLLASDQKRVLKELVLDDRQRA